MFTLTVTLLSGQMVTLEVDGNTRIAELRQMAQLKLGRTLVALVTHAGTRLDVFPTLFSTLCSLGLQEGSVVTAVSKAGPILQSHRKASTFAAIRADGTVITWGQVSRRRQPRRSRPTCECAESLCDQQGLGRCQD